MEHFPLTPVEEDGRLHDPKLRENFIEQVFVMKRWRELLGTQWSMGPLVDFHSRNKLLILSHSPKHYTMMGKLVADGKKMDITELYRRYEALLVEATRLKTTARKNSNVLQHIMGYFKNNYRRMKSKKFRNYTAVSRWFHPSRCAGNVNEPLCSEISTALSRYTNLPESPSNSAPIEESRLGVKGLGLFRVNENNYYNTRPLFGFSPEKVFTQNL